MKKTDSIGIVIEHNYFEFRSPTLQITLYDPSVAIKYTTNEKQFWKLRKKQQLKIGEKCALIPRKLHTK